MLLRAYELTSPEMTIPERIALTMERGGVSIMFTSITDLVAFLIGSTSALSIALFSHESSQKYSSHIYVFCI